jgi:hypothetical protein
MPGLPGIMPWPASKKAWMAGINPAMTEQVEGSPVRERASVL